MESGDNKAASLKVNPALDPTRPKRNLTLFAIVINILLIVVIIMVIKDPAAKLYKDLFDHEETEQAISESKNVSETVFKLVVKMISVLLIFILVLSILKKMIAKNKRYTD